MKGDHTKTQEIKPLQVEIKSGEYMWLIPTNDGGFTCGFSNRISDRTDIPIAKVMYHVCFTTMFLLVKYCTLYYI